MSRTHPRRWWALSALSLSVLVVALDLFVLSLALPTLSADLRASSSDLQWFVDAYSLVLAAVLLPAGLLGDRIGRKRILLIALAMFGLASLACAYSTSAGELIAARAVLGLAAAVILPMSLAVLPVLFTAHERPRAIAAVGGATFLGYPIGPILGGWLLDHFWWGSVFLINVPVVVIAIVAVATLMPESRGESAVGVDIAGIVISSAGLALETYGLIKAGNDAIGQRLQTPRRSKKRASDARQLTGPPVSPKALVAAGFTVMAIALATGAGTTIASSTGFAATWFAVTGFGLGLAMPTALNVALGALSAARSGAGSALITAMRQVGGTIGVAVLGTVLATAYQGRLHPTGLPAATTAALKSSVADGVATARATGSRALLDAVRAAYVHGLDVMLWVCAGIAIASALLALAFLPRSAAEPTPTSDDTATGDTAGTNVASTAR